MQSELLPACFGKLYILYLFYILFLYNSILNLLAKQVTECSMFLWSGFSLDMQCPEFRISSSAIRLLIQLLYCYLLILVDIFV